MKVTVSRSPGTQGSLRTTARLCRKALAFLKVDAELGVTFVTPAGMRELNNRYRGRDSTTDVLSFPMQEFSGLPPFVLPEGESLLGDIVIDSERALEQAKKYKVTPEQEMTRLLVHGILHLLGYDHEKSPADARKMRREENRLIKELETSEAPARGKPTRKTRKKPQ